MRLRDQSLCLALVSQSTHSCYIQLCFINCDTFYEINKLYTSRAQGNTNKYQRLYDVTSPLTSPSPTRKHFCWPPEEPVQVKSCQRRVHFAEPVEQSVIEIEPRRPRRRYVISKSICILICIINMYVNIYLLT